MFKNWCKPNDWVLTEAIQARWESQSTDTYLYCYYKFLYSKSRNKHKLKMEGYRPKEHCHYMTALSKLSELENNSINE